MLMVTVTVMLVLTLRPESAVAGDVSMGVACGAGCGGTIKLGDALANTAPGGNAGPGDFGGDTSGAETAEA